MINILLNLCFTIGILSLCFEMIALTFIYGWSVLLQWKIYPNIDHLPDKLFDKENFKPWKGILHR